MSKIFAEVKFEIVNRLSHLYIDRLAFQLQTAERKMGHHHHSWATTKSGVKSLWHGVHYWRHSFKYDKAWNNLLTIRDEVPPLRSKVDLALRGVGHA